MTHEAKNEQLPLRHCIVCRETFQPRRRTQVFSPTPDCWLALLGKENLMTIQKAQAIVRQEAKCYFCGAVMDKVTAPVFLDPSKAARDIRFEDVVVAHTKCRTAYYQGLATGLEPVTATHTPQGAQHNRLEFAG